MRKNFSHHKGTHSHPKRNLLMVVIILIIAGLVGSAILVRNSYQNNLRPLNNSSEPIVVTIDPGSLPNAIADTLKTRGVIKSDWAFEWYVRNHDLQNQLKAGTYVLKPSQTIPEIIDQIIDGQIATDLVTILPGRRLDQIKDDLVKSGFKADDIEKALDPKNYAGHPALTDKPPAANLEGYLYPESFQKTAQTTAQDIIEKSLDEMARYLTPEIRSGFSEQKLSAHQGVILASVVEQEVSKLSDKPLVAQVLLKRYSEGMKLGADPTALFGAIKAGKTPNLAFDSPYNTRIHTGLPPGPIGNVSTGSLNAVAFPAQTDWLYFVAGDDGVTYFSKTLEEHEALTKEHCKQLCNSY